MLRNILTFHHLGMQVLVRGGMLRSVIELPIREQIARMRYVEESDLTVLDKLEDEIKAVLGKISAAGGELDELS